MRDDLLDAYTAVDWAKAHLPSVVAYVNSWKHLPTYRLIEESHPEMGKKFLKFADIKPIPRLLSFEAGIIIHSLRSSLDVLANKLAERHGHVSAKNVYFPICSTAAEFKTGKHAGHKKISKLTPSDQTIIESLQPYNRGYELLAVLHNLDLRRKHRSLLEVSGNPVLIQCWPWGQPGGLEFPSMWQGLKDGAILAWTGIDTTNYEIEVTLTIALNEAGALTGKPIDVALAEFANLTGSIIALFDK